MKEMSETKQNCKFFLLRYVPDAVKDEFVNIGLVLLPPQAPPELRFTEDWSRVHCLNPDADLDLLKAFRDELIRDSKQDASREELLKRIEDAFSNVLQASEYKACVTAAPAREADELAGMYLETVRRRPSADKAASRTIYQSIKSAFEEAGVWQRMRKDIAASEYARAGDPLEIDCGYRFDSTIKMFHGTSLRLNVNAAKVLAFSYPELAAGIRRKDGAQTRLTAIIEDGLEKEGQVEFALETLERSGILVATVSNLPDLAATAARDMRI